MRFRPRTGTLEVLEQEMPARRLLPTVKSFGLALHGLERAGQYYAASRVLAAMAAAENQDADDKLTAFLQRAEVHMRGLVPDVLLGGGRFPGSAMEKNRAFLLPGLKGYAKKLRP